MIPRSFVGPFSCLILLACVLGQVVIKDIAHATLFAEEETACPVCGRKFSRKAPMSTTIGGYDSDMRPRFVGASTLFSRLISCPSCRYTAHSSGFHNPPKLAALKKVFGARKGQASRMSVEALVDEAVKSPKKKDTLPQRVADAERSYSVGWEKDPNAGAKLYHLIAWLYRQRGNPKEKEWLRKALGEYKKLYKRIPAKALTDRLHVSYLIGDLSFRLGEHADQRRWFTRARRHLKGLRRAAKGKDPECGEIKFIAGWLKRRRL